MHAGRHLLKMATRICLWLVIWIEVHDSALTTLILDPFSFLMFPLDALSLKVMYYDRDAYYQKYGCYQNNRQLDSEWAHVMPQEERGCRRTLQYAREEQPTPDH